MVSWWFTVLLLIGVLGLTVYILLSYPSKSTPIYAYVLVSVALLFSLGIVMLLPYDVYLEVSDTRSLEDKHFLEVSWKVVYWTLFTLCWFILPFMQIYLMAGDFTILNKIKTALYQQFRNLIIFACVGVVFVIYLLITKRLTPDNLPAFMIAAGNAMGLFQVILLLGYGLVAIPKVFWYRGNLKATLNYSHFKISSLHTQLADTKQELVDLVKQINSYYQALPHGHPYKPYTEHMLDKVSYIQCPSDFLGYPNSSINQSSSEIITEEDLAELNRKLKETLSEYYRGDCRWEKLTSHAFKIEDINENYNNYDKRIVSEFWQAKSGRYARFREVTEWVWYTRLHPIVCRIFGMLFAIFSLFIVLGEITLFSSTPVGVFPLAFEEDHGPIGTQLLCLIPLLYIILCTYLALFRLKLKGRYGLYQGNQTDPSNLCWSAFTMAKLAPPLCYNFLLFIKMHDSVFYKVYGVLNLVPILGQGFSMFFPLLLVVFVIMNLFDLYSKIMSKLGMAQYTFSEGYDDEMITEGRSLLARARIDKTRGNPNNYTSSYIERHSIEKSTQETKSRIEKFDKIEKAEKAEKSESIYERIRKSYGLDKSRNSSKSSMTSIRNSTKIDDIKRPLRQGKFDV